MSSPWSDDEVEILKAHYDEHGASWDGWAMLLPDRSENAICKKAHGIKMERAVKAKARKPRAKRAVDSREAVVLRMMKQGMSPSQIDRKMKWVPGRTHSIVIDRWRRDW